jgi:hypothetical protein
VLQYISFLNLDVIHKSKVIQIMPAQPVEFYDIPTPPSVNPLLAIMIKQYYYNDLVIRRSNYETKSKA